MMTVFFSLFTVLAFCTSTVATDEACQIIAFGDSNAAIRGKVNFYAKHLLDKLGEIPATNAEIGGNHT